MWPCGSRPEPNGARLRSQELAEGSSPTVSPRLSFKHIPCDASDCSRGTDQLGKEAEGVGLPASLSRSALVCSRSSPLLPNCVLRLSLCAQAFAGVLKLPKRLPMCAQSNSQHKDSHLWSSANSQTILGRRAALRCFAARCFLGIFWVPGYFVGCMQMQCRPAVSRVTELGPRPCWDPRGSSCCPAQGFSHQRRRCHPAQCPAIHTAPGSPP